MSKDPILEAIDHQTKLQGVANTLGDMLVDALNSTDAELLAMLRKELKSIRKILISGNGTPADINRRLNEIGDQIERIRGEGIKNAFEITQGQAGSLAALQSAKTAGEVETWMTQLAAAKETEKTIREKFIPKTLKQKQIDDIVKYERIDGFTIEQWFGNYADTDTNRIFQAVQRGVSEGTTLQGIMKQITGGSEEFGDGVIPIKGALETSRDSARMLARTTINGVANATRMDVYAANADVLDGVQWLATLDTRTCPVCGELDGKIWKTSEMLSVKRPPAHPSCRCVLLPYIDLGETDSTRAAEVADFDKMAEDRYNEAQREKGSDKRYSDLSYDTRKKKRYDEIREWKKDGKEPYRQVKGNYIDYVKTLPPEEQRRLLGSKRFEMLKAGTLTDEQSKKPDAGYRKTLDDLKPKDDNKPVKESPKQIEYREMKESDYNTFATESWKQYEPQEQKTIEKYVNSSYELNVFLQDGITDGTDPSILKERIKILDSVIQKVRLQEDTILYHGFGSKWDDEPEFTLQSFLSTSISKDFAKEFIGGKEQVIFEIHAKSGTPVIPVGNLFLPQFEIIIGYPATYKIVGERIEEAEYSSLLKKGKKEQRKTRIIILEKEK